MGPFVTLNLLWILKVNQIINSVVFLCKIITELGAVAQLGERVVRNDEVGGSNPPSSTKSLFLPLTFDINSRTSESNTGRGAHCYIGRLASPQHELRGC